MRQWPSLASSRLSCVPFEEQLRALLRAASLNDAASAKNELDELVKKAARPERAA